MRDLSGGGVIVVGVDGSQEALAGVRWAAGQAVLWRVPLRVVHAFEWPDRPHLGDPGLGVDAQRVLRDRAEGWLREAEQVARSVAGADLDLSADLQVGHPVELLVRHSAGASLVVLGSRGLGGLAELLVGSVSVEVSARAACPVAVVRGTPSPDGPVIVGVDGSPLSEEALAYAYAAADAARVPLVAVHVWNKLALDPVFERLPTHTWERELLAQRLAGWAEKYPDVEVRRIAEPGHPARTLLRAAAGARLVVVGSRGRGGFTGLLLGSTSRALLHHAPCPVVVVRPHHDD